MFWCWRKCSVENPVTGVSLRNDDKFYQPFGGLIVGDKSDVTTAIDKDIA
jgi:hypothetical protein